MVLCFVPWCKNRSDHRHWKRTVNSGNKDIKITFHSFPKDDTARSLWLDILGINVPSTPSGARICSMHFEEKFLDRSSSSLVRLKPNALPRREFPTEPVAETNVSDSTIKIQTKSPDPDQNSVMKALDEVCHLQNITHEASSSITNTSIPQPSTSKIDKATMVSFEQIYKSPEKCRLRQRIEFLKEESRKKIRNLQQCLRRQTDQIASLKNVLKILREKDLLNEEQADMLHTLGGSNGEIFRRLIRRRSNETVPRQYEPELQTMLCT